MTKLKDTNIQNAIGWALRIGVIVSVIVVFIGGVIYLFKQGHTVPDYSTFKGVPDFVRLESIINSALTLKGRAIIQGGIILLIATPVIRIIFSAVGFALEKDHLYTFITLLVLAIIIISMINGHVG